MIDALTFMSLSRWRALGPLRPVYGCPGATHHALTHHTPTMLVAVVREEIVPDKAHPTVRVTHHVAVVIKEIVTDEASRRRELAVDRPKQQAQKQG